MTCQEPINGFSPGIYRLYKAIYKKNIFLFDCSLSFIGVWLEKTVSSVLHFRFQIVLNEVAFLDVEHLVQI